MSDKVWVYVGKGAFIDGVPARDLGAADLARLDDFQRAAVEASGLYRRAPRRAAEPEAGGTPDKAQDGAKGAPDKDEGKGAKGAPKE